MELILLICTLVLAAAAVVLGILNLTRRQDTSALEQRLADELRKSRQEMAAAVNEAVRSSAAVQAESQKQLAERQDAHLRDVMGQLASSQNVLQKNVNMGLASLDERMKTFGTQNEQKLENIRTAVNSQLAALQAGNEKKLEEMRHTVDEKLQQTLEERLKRSFSLVSDRLEQVHKGLGEMQNLATGVGDLKKVLSNVKTRGILGEIQLGAILEEILSPEQYEANVATVTGSNDRVEFAVKLPGDGEGETVWLPIDAKFPADAYANLLEAYDAGDTESIAAVGKVLETRIRGFAKDIHDKYIRVPDTTEFGVMFLPVEGLYAEVVRRGLVDRLQREYKVNVAGPSTMAALLNSLQMGFRTLAIQKRSGEVWKVLGEVKTEFVKFETVLVKAKDNMDKATRHIDDLMGVRTRQIQRKLKDVTALPAVGEDAALPDAPDEE